MNDLLDHLTKKLKESMEIRKQTATANEEKKDGFWSRLFGGK